MLAAECRIPVKNIESDAPPRPRVQQLAEHVAKASRVKHAEVHVVAGKQAQVFLANGSQVRPVSDSIAMQIQAFVETNSEQPLMTLLANLGFRLEPFISDEPLRDPSTHALSLAIAQKCNMGCTYCYAEQGDFGGSGKSMSLTVAQQSIDLLLQDKNLGERVTLSFMGGEPLINRKEVIAATEYAHAKALAQGVKINFSITTNGTLVTPDDAVFFEKYGFAVTVSIDGNETEHNQLRPMQGGRGSYTRIMERIKPLLDIQKKMQVSARVTVTPRNMNLVETLDDLIAMGFHSVGFSPLLKSSNGLGEMSKEDLQILLSEMIACGLKFEESVLKGKRYPFLNMVNAHKEIGRATHRPYPCGAGAGYMGVSADGELAACHRFVNDEQGALGDVVNGIDADRQREWLAERHVHAQDPCTECWARYLCAGSCHHEVIDRGRTACDYIRGWLYFSLQSYGRLQRLAPQWMS